MTIRDTVYVLVRRIDPGDFRITPSSRLGGVALKPWLDQPRTVRPDGTLDLDIYALALAEPGDAEAIQVGEILELTGSTPERRTSGPAAPDG